MGYNQLQPHLFKISCKLLSLVKQAQILLARMGIHLNKVLKSYEVKNHQL